MGRGYLAYRPRPGTLAIRRWQTVGLSLWVKNCGDAPLYHVHGGFYYPTDLVRITGPQVQDLELAPGQEVTFEFDVVGLHEGRGSTRYYGRYVHGPSGSEESSGNGPGIYVTYDEPEIIVRANPASLGTWESTKMEVSLKNRSLCSFRNLDFHVNTDGDILIGKTDSRIELVESQETGKTYFILIGKSLGEAASNITASFTVSPPLVGEITEQISFDAPAITVSHRKPAVFCVPAPPAAGMGHETVLRVVVRNTINVDIGDIQVNLDTQSLAPVFFTAEDATKNHADHVGPGESVSFEYVLSGTCPGSVNPRVDVSYLIKRAGQETETEEDVSAEASSIRVEDIAVNATANPMIINSGDIARLHVSIHNNSAFPVTDDSAVTLSAIDSSGVLVNLSPDTVALGEVLGGAPRLESGKTAVVRFDLQGNASGHATVSVDVVCRLDTSGSALPIPEDCRVRTTALRVPVQRDYNEEPAQNVEQAPGVLLGRLQSADSPVGDADVTVYPGDHCDKSLESGNFFFPGLQPGDYEMTVSREGYRERIESVSIRAGETAELDLELERIPYIGNKNTKELHVPGCSFLELVKPENRVYFEETAEALRQGYNGCHYCLRKLDTG